MPITDSSFYKTRQTFLSEMLTALQGYVQDAYMGEDGVLRILFTVESSQFENLSLANQILLEDMFIQTASLPALRLHGEQAGLAMSQGTLSAGYVRFEGDGGTYIPLNTTLAYDAGTGLDIQYFLTTTDGTIPDPGDPTAPDVAVGATGGMSGDYEYAIAFVTDAGETLIGLDSDIVSVSNQAVNLTNIPLGGPGTTERRVYRQKGGTGDYNRVGVITNNTTTSLIDTMSDAVAATQPLAMDVDTAHAIVLQAQSLVPGSETNVAPYTITIVSDGPGGITQIFNPTAFAGGSDPEDSETYRKKLLAFVQAPQTGSAGDLKVWSESVTGVESATVFENDNMGVVTPGHTTVRISGPGGSIPDPALEDEVLLELQSHGIANITYHVGTFLADVQDVTVDVTTDPDYTLGDVTPSVQQAIVDYINKLAVGGTLYLSGIVDAVFGLAGVADVVVTSPATNQTTAATHKKTPGTISVA